jgi:tRNA threonylcarbamoyladenosine biosynthesis protein TsaB
VAESTWQAAGRHTAQLLPALDALCRATNLPPETWSAVAVATGPGSFNGIRSGIAAALGLAVSRDIPLAGVGTLDVLAYQAYLSVPPTLLPRQAAICAVLPAGRGEVYYATYQPARALGQSGSWAAASRVGGPVARPPDDVIAALRAEFGAGSAPLIVCGVVAADLLAALDTALGPRAVVANPAAGLRRATYLALLAEQYFQAGGQDQVLGVAPLYLRRVAVTRSRRPFPALDRGHDREGA